MKTRIENLLYDDGTVMPRAESPEVRKLVSKQDYVEDTRNLRE